MFHLQNNPGRTAIVDGKEYLFFSGYSYLGMQHVPEFVELVKEGMDKYGWVFPSSRISNTQLDLFTAFEDKLASITGQEACVCFSSGFLAGRAVMDILKDKSLSCAPNTHPAICTQKGNYMDFHQWKETITDVSAICLDSVNPLTAVLNDISFLTVHASPVTCVIDDSHGAGLLNDGAGIAASLKVNEYVNYIISFSLSKSYGLQGGVVCCSKQIAEQLRMTAQYTASTSIAPAFAFAFLKGQHIYKQQREKLKKNILYFTQLIKNRFSSDKQLPIFVLPTNTDIEPLEKNNIIISSFAYPDPSGQKINRIVLNALHTEEDLHRLADLLE